MLLESTTMRYLEIVIITQYEFIVVGKSILDPGKPVTPPMRIPLASISGLVPRGTNRLEIHWDGQERTVMFDPSIQGSDVAAFQGILYRLLAYRSLAALEASARPAGGWGPTHPVSVAGIPVPGNLAFDALLIGEAGYGIEHPVLFNVLVSSDAEALLLVDPVKQWLYAIPAARYVDSDYQGGQYSRGGNLIGGGFGIVGAAVGMASAAAINRLTRKEGIETVWVLTTDDGELTFYTEEGAPDDINTFLGDFRVASRRARAAALAQAGAPAQDLAGQLGRLAELHAAGALSDEEFLQAKQRVVGGPPA